MFEILQAVGTPVNTPYLVDRQQGFPIAPRVLNTAATVEEIEDCHSAYSIQGHTHRRDTSLCSDPRDHSGEYDHDQEIQTEQIDDEITTAVWKSPLFVEREEEKNKRVARYDVMK